MTRGVLKYANKALRRRLLAGAEPRWLRVHVRRSYIVAAVLASPEWVDRGALRELCARADLLERETGCPHVCDHVVPLNHPDVCGLNVPWNVEVVPHAVNAYKSNRHHPDQLTLL